MKSQFLLNILPQSTWMILKHFWGSLFRCHPNETDLRQIPPLHYMTELSIYTLTNFISHTVSLTRPRQTPIHPSSKIQPTFIVSWFFPSTFSYLNRWEWIVLMVIVDQPSSNLFLQVPVWLQKIFLYLTPTLISPKIGHITGKIAKNSSFFIKLFFCPTLI